MHKLLRTNLLIDQKKNSLFGKLSDEERDIIELIAGTYTEQLGKGFTWKSKLAKLFFFDLENSDDIEKSFNECSDVFKNKSVEDDLLFHLSHFLIKNYQRETI
jgi:hypothetical protein